MTKNIKVITSEALLKRMEYVHKQYERLKILKVKRQIKRKVTEYFNNKNQKG